MADMEAELEWFTSPSNQPSEEPPSLPYHAASSSPGGLLPPFTFSTPATSVQYQQQYHDPQMQMYQQQMQAQAFQPQPVSQQPVHYQQPAVVQQQLFEGQNPDGTMGFFFQTPQGFVPAFPGNTSSPSPAVQTHAPVVNHRRGLARIPQPQVEDEYDDEGINWDEVPDQPTPRHVNSSRRHESKRLERRDREIKDLKQRIEDQERAQLQQKIAALEQQLADKAGSNALSNYQDNHYGGSMDAQAYQPQSYQAGPQAFQNYPQQGSSRNVAQAPPPPPRHGVTVPAITNKKSITLRPVTAIPDQQRSIFKFPVFNAVQSKCFPILYETDDNMVASAPTGAGKTVLFEISMLKMFKRDKEAKVVYIAPTKSLCSERVRDWKQKFSSFGGIKVAELTGDTSAAAIGEAKAARLIVTTPEKWDSVTRKNNTGSQWYRAVQLFCIDEVHLLAEERGATLEVIVSRMKSLDTDYLRFVAVSATVPNIEDVALWIGLGKHAPLDADGNQQMAHVMKFSDEFRPCPLQKIVYGYPAGSKGDHAFDSGLNYKLLELIVKHSSGKPALVFCNTRKGCHSAAEQISKDYDAANHSKHAPPWPKPVRQKVLFSDAALQKLAVNGIGVHSGGISLPDRRLTEELYLAGHLRVICTTSTLAIGVNLPARMVIIKNTKLWDANIGKQVAYTDLDILQMMGRAGRPQFDDSGVAVIMCAQDEKDTYEAMANSQTILESCLHKTLVEHVNSEISTGTIRSMSDAYRWLRNSFLYVRIKRNPEFYRAVVGDLKDGDGDADMQTAVNPETRLEEMVAEAVQSLVTEELAEDDGNEITATKYGDMLCSYSIRFPTFLHLNKLPKKASKAVLLEYLSQATEFKDIRYRGGEKAAYAELNKRDEMKYPLAQVVEPCDKVNILLQLQLSGVNMHEIKQPNANPGAEVGVVLQHAGRITQCLVDLATEKKDGVMAKNALEICITVKSWEHVAGFLTQIDGIGIAYAKKLWDMGLRRISDIFSADAQSITNQVGRRGDFGSQIKSHVKRLPVFAASIVINEEKIRQDDVRVEFTATVRITNGNMDRLLVGKGATKWSMSVLMTTTDGHFIAYDKLRLEKLKKLKNSEWEMKKATNLTRPSQKIEVQVTCDHFVGISCTAYAALKTPASSYPIPMFGSPSPEDEQEKAGSGNEDEAMDSDTDMPSGTTSRKTKKLPKNPKKAAATTSGPARLPNGKYRCGHACRDRTTCKHDCCLNGQSEPPGHEKEKRKEKTPDQDMGYESDTATKKPKKPAKKKSAKEIIGKTMNDDCGDSDISTFVRGNRNFAASTSSGFGSSSFGASTQATTVPDDDDDDDLPDLSEAAKFPVKKRSMTNRTDDEDNESDSMASKRKKKTGKAPPSGTLKDAPRRHNLNVSPPKKRKPQKGRAEYLDDSDEASQKSSKSLDEFPIPPPLGQKPYTPPRRLNKTPLFKPPSTQSEQDELMEEMDGLDDTKGTVEDDAASVESKYGSENEPEPAGSEAEEDNMAWLEHVEEED